MSLVSSVAGFPTLIAMLLLSGCAAIDQFDNRTSSFNEATAQTKVQSIIKNIVRSTYGEPLQFTDISTASGTATVESSLSVSSSVPTRGGFGTPLAQQFLGLTPAARASGQNQFTLNNQANQEFYNGLQAPISSQIVSSYLLSGFDPRILLMLSINEIEIISNGTRTILRNDAATDDQFFGFLEVVRKMLGSGLSAEQFGDATQIGPKLSSAEAMRLLPSIIESTASDVPTLRGDERSGFQLTKRGLATRFCFDPLKSSTPQRLARLEYFTSSTNSNLAELILLKESSGMPVKNFSFKPAPGDLCGANQAIRSDRPFEPNVKIRLRSVQGMFYYLGQITRLQLGLKDGVKYNLEIPRENDRGLNIFLLNTTPISEGFSIEHRGGVYSVILDPTGRYDSSSRVLQFLTDMLALQSSAKNYNSPGLVTLVGQ